MSHTLKNNFRNLKTAFKNDTGMEADKNIEIYIQYYNARINDNHYQTYNYLTTELLITIERYIKSKKNI